MTADTQESKKRLDSALAPLILLTAFLGVVIAAVDSVAHIFELLDSQFYLLTTVLWAATILSALRFRVRRSSKAALRYRTARVMVIAVATVVFAFAVGWRFYDLHWRDTPPGSSPPTIRLSIGRVFLGTAFAQSARPDLRIASFYVNDELSSYDEFAMTFVNIPAGKLYRTFGFDQRVAKAFREGRCIGPQGERPIEAVLPILRKHLTNQGRTSLLKYVSSREAFARLGGHRRGLFDHIMFSNAELREMRIGQPQTFSVVKEWILNCVGVYQPVISLIVENASDRQLILTNVVYDVKDVGTVKGGLTGPLYPEITYDHTIKHEAGRQKRLLEPPLRISAHDVGSFNLRLFSATKGSGLAWIMSIEVGTSDGTSAKTEPFQLIMSK